MTLSTHVLDTATGRPREGVAVSLAAAQEPDAPELARAATDADGRAVLLAGEVPAGAYRLRFALPGGFYPWIDVVVATAATERLHVPLLLSPFGYTTYRGS